MYTFVHPTASIGDLAALCWMGRKGAGTPHRVCYGVLRTAIPECSDGMTHEYWTSEQITSRLSRHLKTLLRMAHGKGNPRKPTQCLGLSKTCSIGNIEPNQGPKGSTESTMVI